MCRNRFVIIVVYRESLDRLNETVSNCRRQLEMRRRIINWFM